MKLDAITTDDTGKKYLFAGKIHVSSIFSDFSKRK